MNASGTRFQYILQGQQQSMIPLFQRPFTWVETNFESLWNDLIEVYEAEAEEQHFLGSIVTKVLDATPQGVSRSGAQIDKRGGSLAERAIRMWTGPIR